MVAASSKFPKSDRLLSERDFAVLLKKAHEGGRKSGRIQNGSFFRVYRDGSDSPAKLGLTISRKTLKNSVDRNRVKRVLRDYFRKNKDRLSGALLVRLDRRPPNFDYETLTQPLALLTQNLENSSEKLNVASH